VLSGSQEYKRLFCVTGRKYIVTPILNHHFRDLADKHIVLNNQYHGHHNSFGRDN